MNTKRTRSRQPNRFEKVWEAYEDVYAAAKRSSGKCKDSLAICINSMHKALCSAERGGPAGRLQTRLLIVARQQGILTQERWDHLMGGFKPDTAEWKREIDALFLEFFGRELNRRNTRQVSDDIKALAAMDSNPWLGDEGQQIMNAYNDKHAWRGKRLTMAFFWKPKKEEPRNEELKDSDGGINELRRMFVESLSKRPVESQQRIKRSFAEMGLSGLLELPQGESPTEDNPEQVAHVDQAAIDVAFGELMAGLDF